MKRLRLQYLLWTEPLGETETLDHELPELHSKTLTSIKLLDIAVCDLMITLSYITISCNPIDLFEIYIGYN